MTVMSVVLPEVDGRIITRRIYQTRTGPPELRLVLGAARPQQASRDYTHRQPRADAGASQSRV